ncbi:hypothetical protein E8D34_13320 [Nocardioides sp. GY 10113]|uniref:hypothetical protein n=1 Tax=Nocardioides sp. GY 10113 TaxID=2569761 RepID=UPI0010A81E6D|nr:hypothetical protein [Nocardioides sp. GY 10113]TIC85052.1 hypothetical protein E8D34_13320 [Nocardioides sp. GY 10113]
MPHRARRTALSLLLALGAGALAAAPTHAGTPHQPVALSTTASDPVGDVRPDTSSGNAPERVLRSVDLSRIRYALRLDDDGRPKLLRITYRIDRVLHGARYDQALGTMIGPPRSRLTVLSLPSHHRKVYVVSASEEIGDPTDHRCRAATQRIDRDRDIVKQVVPARCLGGFDGTETFRSWALLERPGGADLAWDRTAPMRLPQGG